MATILEICANCNDKIGKLETPYIWKNAVVCPACYGKLSASQPAPKQSVLTENDLIPMVQPSVYSSILPVTARVARPAACYNCQKKFGRLDKPYSYHGHFICGVCHGSLVSRPENSTMQKVWAVIACISFPALVVGAGFANNLHDSGDTSGLLNLMLIVMILGIIGTFAGVIGFAACRLMK